MKSSESKSPKPESRFSSVFLIPVRVPRRSARRIPRGRPGACGRRMPDACRHQLINDSDQEIHIEAHHGHQPSRHALMLDAAIPLSRFPDRPVTPSGSGAAPPGLATPRFTAPLGRSAAGRAAVTRQPAAAPPTARARPARRCSSGGSRLSVAVASESLCLVLMHFLACSIVVAL